MDCMFTIVIPTKNEEIYLPVLLETIRKQTFRPVEVIVADAGSTDATREIAARFGARIVEGGLPGAGRNRGAAEAKTPFILFLDADVRLDDPTILERAFREMEDRWLDIATCDVAPSSDSRLDRALHKAYNSYVRMVRPVMPHAPGFCIFVKKKLHDEIGGFDETVTFCEDHDYAHRASHIGRFGFLSVSVPVSTRRLDRDGRANIALKYALAELHLATIGPIRHKLFNYTFGHSSKKQI